eukprot:COSAG02_NODE_64_length_43111_cov_35.627709_9_plen_95_part_00
MRKCLGSASENCVGTQGTIGIWLPFIIGSFENRMRKNGLTLLDVRKRFSMLGTLTQAMSTVLFVLAPTPFLACAANCCQYVLRWGYFKRASRGV